MQAESAREDMDELAIRRAETEDAAALAEVYHSAYRENRDLGFPAKAESVTGSTVADWIADHHVYVAHVDGRIVGGVRLEEPDPGRLKLSRLGVHEDWKGQGIGGRLLDHVESVARDWGYETIWLTTPETHPYLPDFYRSRGYETAGEYPLDYRDYDEVIMEKRV